MLDIIYYFNIFGCLTMGMALLLIQTAPQLINPHYRNAKRFLGIASIIVALCNALILTTGYRRALPKYLQCLCSLRHSCRRRFLLLSY